MRQSKSNEVFGARLVPLFAKGSRKNANAAYMQCHLGNADILPTQKNREASYTDNAMVRAVLLR